RRWGVDTSPKRKRGGWGVDTSPKRKRGGRKPEAPAGTFPRWRFGLVSVPSLALRACVRPARVAPIRSLPSFLFAPALSLLPPSSCQLVLVFSALAATPPRARAARCRR